MKRARSTMYSPSGGSGDSPACSRLVHDVRAERSPGRVVPAVIGPVLRARAALCLLAVCAALAFVVAALLEGCATNPVTGKSEFSLISESDEIALGTQAYPGAVAEFGGEYNDPLLSEYVSGIGHNLAAVSHRPKLPYEFTVVGSSIVNAFALPGGKIVVTTGLISRFESEGQIAGVLGHEIGHVTARHAARAISRAYLFQIGLVAGAVYADRAGRGEELVALSSVGLALLQLKYSRDQEAQSDELGMDYAVKAGYNPNGVVQLLEVLKSSHDREPSAFEGMFLTHPLTSSRIRDARGKLASDYPEWQARTEQLFVERFEEKTRRLMEHVGAFEHYDAAEKHLHDGDLDQALREYTAAVEMDGEQPQFHCGMGEVFLERDDVPSALESFRRAKELSPELFRSRLDLGRAQFQAEEYGAAAENLEAAVSLVRTSPTAHYYLGRSYEKLGRRADAVKSYENAAALAPDTDLGRDAQRRASSLKG